MKVADVMSKQVDFVSPNSSVKEVSYLIFGRNINGVPVCRDKKLIGFITERDILSKFYPSIGEYVDDPFRAGDFEAMEEKVEEIFSITAKDIMSHNPITVTSETPLLRAQSLMFIHKVGRLPVIDEEGNLIGIISKGDIFRASVGGKLELVEDEDYNDWLSKRYYSTVNWENRLSFELPDLIKVFSKNKVKKVLDVGCGTGEHTIELAKRGFTVVGIERSKSMIQEANNKISSLSGEVKKKIMLLTGEHGDTANLYREGNFDAALFLGNTISHNPYTWKEVIKKTEQVLSQKGIMIFQITNFEKVLRVQNRILNASFVKKMYESSSYQEHFFLEYYDPSRDGGKTVLKTFVIFDFNGKRWKFYGLRNALFAYITMEKIDRILKTIGYADILFYGSSFNRLKWDYLFRNPFMPLESDWLNVIAKR